MFCCTCGNELETDAVFCSKCGTKIEDNSEVHKFCIGCGNALDKDSVFCTKCGKRVNEVLYQDSSVKEGDKPAEPTQSVVSADNLESKEKPTKEETEYQNIHVNGRHFVYLNDSKILLCPNCHKRVGEWDSLCNACNVSLIDETG